MLGEMTESRRFGMAQLWVSAIDLRRALGCSRALACEHLRRASRWPPGERGLLRVPLHVRERYARQVLSCSRSSIEPGSGTGGSRSTAGGWCGPLRCRDRRAAERVARQWELDAADPDHATHLRELAGGGGRAAPPHRAGHGAQGHADAGAGLRPADARPARARDGVRDGFAAGRLSHICDGAHGSSGSRGRSGRRRIGCGSVARVRIARGPSGFAS